VGGFTQKFGAKGNKIIPDGTYLSARHGDVLVTVTLPWRRLKLDLCEPNSG
jgi:hypothetical protein